MATMNVSLPDTLKAFVDEQVAEHGFGTTSEYVRDLIRYDRDRAVLRDRILAAGEDPVAAPMDSDWFDSLRALVRASTDTSPAA